jgi:hypothetical protein
MKRTLVVLAIVGAVVGGAGIAWAQTSGSGTRAANRAAAKACLQQAKTDNPGADKATLKDAVKSCLSAQGITLGRNLTADQKAAARVCLQQAKDANPGADRLTILAAARPCLEQAGVVKPLTADQQARRAKILSCLEQAKAANPGADRATLRQAAKACVQAG